MYQKYTIVLIDNVIVCNISYFQILKWLQILITIKTHMFEDLGIFRNVVANRRLVRQLRVNINRFSILCMDILYAYN